MTKRYKTVSLILPGQHTVMLENAALLFGRALKKRTGLGVSRPSEGGLRIELTLDEKIGREGFQIGSTGNDTVSISGGSEQGILYGVGKFLRTSRYSPGTFTPSTWRGISIPSKEFRGMYFATHFKNYYHAAPLAEIQDYIRDLALWGVNALCVWFDMHHFTGIRDPKAVVMLDRLGAMLKTANEVGMRAGITLLSNEAHRNSPVPLRANGQTGRCHYGVELCPNQPGAKKLMLQWFEEEFRAFADRKVKLDFLVPAPYDQGGCACQRCAPWGCNGYLLMTRAIARLARRTFPDISVVLFPWLFDYPHDQGEWKGLAKALSSSPRWVNYLIAGAHEGFPAHPLQHGVPGGYPFLAFQEISMWEMSPYGGWGANPFPKRIHQTWKRTQARLVGAIPYSEGIYEDINKVICNQLCWDTNRTTDQVLREYIAYEYSPDVVNEVLPAIHILEANNHGFILTPENATSMARLFPNWKRDAGSKKAYRLISRADQKLPAAVRESWRWRILYLRAFLDRERFSNYMYPTRASRAAFEELRRIYHAQNADVVLDPPRISTSAIPNRRQVGRKANSNG